MKTVQISKVARIAQGEMNLIILELANGKPSIIRSPKEFINDLKGSFLVDESVNSMKHPEVREVLMDLAGATLTAELKYAKAGETWTVTKDSQVINNPKTKGFGQYAIGDEKEYEKDATIVTDGFLSIRLSAEVRQENKIASKYASARVSSASGFDIAPDFDGGTSPVANDATEDVVEDEGNVEDETPATNQVKPETAKEAVNG